MLLNLLPPIVLLCFLTGNRVDSCFSQSKPGVIEQREINPYKKIGDIPVPAGFYRVAADSRSFAAWLRKIPLKADKTVYTYKKVPKKNQSAQFAVLDVSVGTRDLQQCADAVMRLRAEFLYDAGRETDICFRDNNGRHYHCPRNANRVSFKRYLEQVFIHCGTASLSKQLKAVSSSANVQPGDVFIVPGFPGHAILVVDVAKNEQGERIFMLAQSYMPAQDIHILVNPVRPAAPWYETGSGRLETPEWTFHHSDLKTW